jgi:hypothetical protein
LPGKYCGGRGSWAGRSRGAGAGGLYSSYWARGRGCASRISFGAGVVLRVRGRQRRLVLGAQPGRQLCLQYQG